MTEQELQQYLLSKYPKENEECEWKEFKNMILDEQDSAYDWTAQAIADATIDDLDSDAIMLAREGYKQRYPKFAKECDSWSDKVFLDKACLTIDGKISNTTIAGNKSTWALVKG